MGLFDNSHQAQMFLQILCQRNTKRSLDQLLFQSNVHICIICWILHLVETLELKTWVFFVGVLLLKFGERPRLWCKRQSIYLVPRRVGLDIEPEKREGRSRCEHTVSKQSLSMVRLWAHVTYFCKAMGSNLTQYRQKSMFY